MITLIKEQVIMLHKCIYDRYGGTYGLRDEGLLDSALMAPFQTFAGQDLYPEDKDKIAHMAYALISNHPFSDGNKRIGAMIYKVAQGAADDRDIRAWIEEHT